jgi:hypothetical protein
LSSVWLVSARAPTPKRRLDPAGGHDLDLATPAGPIQTRGIAAQRALAQRAVPPQDRKPPPTPPSPKDHRLLTPIPTPSPPPPANPAAPSPSPTRATYARRVRGLCHRRRLCGVVHIPKLPRPQPRRGAGGACRGVGAVKQRAPSLGAGGAVPAQAPRAAAPAVAWHCTHFTSTLTNTLVLPRRRMTSPSVIRHQDGHTPVTWYQLTHWEECPSWEGFKASPFTVAGGRPFWRRRRALRLPPPKRPAARPVIQPRPFACGRGAPRSCPSPRLLPISRSSHPSPSHASQAAASCPSTPPATTSQWARPRPAPSASACSSPSRCGPGAAWGGAAARRGSQARGRGRRSPAPRARLRGLAPAVCAPAMYA